MTESLAKKLGNLTNKDFRELLKTHIPKLSDVPKETLKDVIKCPVVEKKEKKSKIKRNERRREDALTELLSRYRDRARERREGKNPDYMNVTDAMSQSGYHAVAHHPSCNLKLTERRRQLIQESKYLGGDMAHTHLVKGLDFALLNKVRSEIEARSKEEEVKEEIVVEDCGFKTHLGKNIQDILFGKRAEKRNHLFGPGKMSYMVDLIEDETDIPTTVIRSKICLQEAGGNMITTDAVIEMIRSVMHGLKENARVKRIRRQEIQQNLPEKKQEKKPEKIGKPSRTEKMLRKLTDEPTSYAECYPGHESVMDAGSDSDTEMKTFGQTLEEEVAPRAVYQFGVKKSCGRKTRLSERGKKAVLDREWARIKNRLHI